MTQQSVRPSSQPLTDLERLTASWIGLSAVLLAARFRILQLAGKAQPSGECLTPWLPLALYQDIGLVVGLACFWGFVLYTTRDPWQRRAVRAAAWMTCLATAWYAAVSVEIFQFLSTPLTYRLIAMSDNLRGIRSSMDAALTHERIGWILSAPLLVIAISLPLIRYGAEIVRQVHGLASTHRWRWGFAAYFGLAFLVARFAALDVSAVANPHVALVKSFLDYKDPMLQGQFRETELGDFQPKSGVPEAESVGSWRGRERGSNILILILESVGTRHLGHYGAPYDTTPELTRLAQRGLTFDRIYTSQPYTSNAMVGLFCSVYPYHGWRSITRRDPDFQATGLCDVLKRNDYRTGLLHTGDMQFDNEKRFLRQHGFDTVHDVWNLQEVLGEVPGSEPPAETPGVHRHLPDSLLPPAALNWIDADRSRPFLLALWTIQTHHPYFAEPLRDSLAPRDPELNRYLNAIRVSDQVLGEVVRGLEARGLLDSTLFVVLGDHGEAFGEHGHRAHSKTLYEEELRIPLVIASNHLTREPVRYSTLGQQIDVAPTVLDLLGLDPPEEWQGRSLFAPARPDRAYFFTGFHHYLFGVVEGHYKYVFNASTGQSQLFDLENDPGERTNLARSSEERCDALHRRLGGWIHFQNPFLIRFLSAN